ncbi:protein HEAT-STRESS-ASSOCIATED 32-like [Pyrus communis]|uniref:protein HEAT-STRESS-ASSOCIATED 32-like n=1 Tax=Pyrus communis TaxID=23211 RepID=UPI0035C14FEA
MGSKESREGKSLGFDTIELNEGSLELPEETLLRFVRLIKIGGLKVKSQFAIRFNKSDIPVGDRAFGAYAISSPRYEYVEDVDLLITRAERCLEAGAVTRTNDADDVCKHAGSMHADIIAKVIGRLGAEKTVFEASNPRTSEWFIKQYGLLQEKLRSVELIFKIDHEVLISRIVRQNEIFSRSFSSRSTDQVIRAFQISFNGSPVMTLKSCDNFLPLDEILKIRIT